MRNLCQEIPASFDARMKRVADIKRETAELLKGFQRDLREKAAELKRFLSNSEASRMKDFRVMHQGIRARHEERSRETADLMNSLRRGSEQRAREVGNMLGGFRRAQKAMASHWQGLAAGMAKRRASFAR
ncbi:MAG: hypothetical protein HZA23_05380 [Nitrospirae bacterium]|nr:hypothetical protein [Nitrospirota bacterium]